MNWKNHFNVAGKHAILGASKYYWVYYDDQKFVDYYTKSNAAEEGTKLHAFAAECIRLGQRLPKSRKTLNMYVNDAIGFKMAPEQTLYYSENCFGTPDAISFRDNILRIHDYKSGINAGHPEQIEIYTALFCLEYHKNPQDIDIELRIYQADEAKSCTPPSERILTIMDKIIYFDKIIAKLKSEED